jgi:hypothetical protein
MNTGEDCSTAAGCVVEDASPVSFGAGFAAAGGGVWAAQFDVSGVLWVSSLRLLSEHVLTLSSNSIWFWSVCHSSTFLGREDTKDGPSETEHPARTDCCRGRNGPH